jgi:hypothetical protein
MFKVYLYEKQAEGKSFYYVAIGSQSHGKPTYRLWINRKLQGIAVVHIDGRVEELPVEDESILKELE